jgi:hypothetical protein
LQTVYAEEREADYVKERGRVEQVVDAAAERFAELPQLIGGISERLQLAEEVDKEVSRLNRSAPSGWAHVLGPELKARGLTSFSSTNPRMGQDMKLPSWGHSEIMSWPIRPAVFTPAFSPPSYDDRYSADWSRAQSRANAERHAKVDKELELAEQQKREFFRGQ